MLEVILIGRRSRSTFNACHKCACFSLEFDSHDVIDHMKAELLNCIIADACLNRRMIRPLSHPGLFQSNCKAKKKRLCFLALRAEQRIESPLLFSFECVRSVLALSMPCAAG